MDLKVYRFVAHFGAASDGAVISWASREAAGRPPPSPVRPRSRSPLGESRRADCGLGAFGPLQLTIRDCVPSTVPPMAYDVSLPIRRRTI